MGSQWSIALPLSPPASPPSSRGTPCTRTSPGLRRHCGGLRRRPQEFNGSVSWEAYRDKLQMLAEARGWGRPNMALQLVGALKGGALEILNQLPARKRTSFSSVTAALERLYGHQHQTEVYRARFRTRIRGPGESLTHLAQDLEQLVRKTYPEASEYMVTILLRDQFVDVVDHPQIRIYIQQAHVKNLQEALARGLEMESFLRTSPGRRSPVPVPGKSVRVRKGRVQQPSPRSPPSPRASRGNCYGCGQQGHLMSNFSHNSSRAQFDVANTGQ